MRLIDADELIKAVWQSRRENEHKHIQGIGIHNGEHDHFINMINHAPIAYDVDKVEREIDRISHIHLSGYPNCCEYDYGLDVGYRNCGKEAIEIVVNGGVDEMREV